MPLPVNLTLIRLRTGEISYRNPIPTLAHPNPVVFPEALWRLRGGMKLHHVNRARLFGRLPETPDPNPNNEDQNPDIEPRELYSFLNPVTGPS